MAKRVLVATCTLAVVWAASICAADLQPAEVAIIAVRGNAESEALARRYAAARGIPEANLCLIDAPADETCPRETWATAIRPAIRAWLDQTDPEHRVRCLATMYGVPLKIGPAALTGDLKGYRDFLAGERSQRMALLRQVIDALGEIVPEEAGLETDEAAAKSRAAGGSDEIGQLQGAIDAALRLAQLRLRDEPVGTRQMEGQSRLRQLVAVTGGVRVLITKASRELEVASPQTGADPLLQAELNRLQGVQAAWAEAHELLQQQPASIERDATLLQVVERLGGQLAAVRWIDAQLALVDRNETGAGFDSELSLVLWPEGYQLLQWQPNYLQSSYDHSQLRESFPTLMVARIDAPTPALAQGLVDRAIAAEQKGLQGTAYFDSRGIAPPEGTPVAAGSNEDFDLAIQRTARGIAAQTDQEAVLNDKPALFQSGECPNAALYCGWYSLGKYVDAFDWAPGAVAYHLGTVEASTLRKSESQVWCKRLIEDGVTATMGPVAESQLLAFPKPDEFYGLLLRGDLTLAECYYRTQPVNSWMMTLIGDPLYRPFKNRPVRNSGAGRIDPATAATR